MSAASVARPVPRRRVAAMPFAAALALGALGGCTVVSGWSDLEGGKRPDASVDGGAGSEGDDADGASARDAGNGDDAATHDSGGSPSGTATSCNGVACPRSEGCCVPFAARGGSCTTQSACSPSSGMAFLACTSSAACARAGAGTVCCLTNNLLAVCQSTCASGEVLCDPSSTADCTGGTTCQPDPVFPGQHRCQ